MVSFFYFNLAIFAFYNRLIVIAEKEVVYNKFPIPLINRLEKHFLVMSSGLTEPQKQLTKKLKAWVEDFAEVFQPAYERPKRFLLKNYQSCFLMFRAAVLTLM